MNIHEYQAKEILGRYGIAVPRGRLAVSARDAAITADEFGGHVVVKAQIHAGGRGKAGGVRFAATRDEAASLYEEFLGMRLITRQTGPEGARVRRVYIEEALSIAKEYYLSLSIDRKHARIALLASAAGGGDVEEASQGAFARVLIDPCLGPTAHSMRALAVSLGLESACRRMFFGMVQKLYEVFTSCDCSLLEINRWPGSPTAGFFLWTVRFLSMTTPLPTFRTLGVPRYRGGRAEEFEASKYGLTYVKLDGDIGCMVNGAGTCDGHPRRPLAQGGTSANFLDLGGGASKEAVRKAFSLIIEDRRVKVILINVLGGIVPATCGGGRRRGDRGGFDGVYALPKRHIPIVVRFAGNRAGEGRSSSKRSKRRLPIRFAETMDAAATLAAGRLAPKEGGRFHVDSRR
jgi:succinyl-CoA synthetase beta subunit